MLWNLDILLDLGNLESLHFYENFCNKSSFNINLKSFKCGKNWGHWPTFPNNMDSRKIHSILIKQKTCPWLHCPHPSMGQ